MLRIQAVSAVKRKGKLREKQQMLVGKNDKFQEVPLVNEGELARYGECV